VTVAEVVMSEEAASSVDVTVLVINMAEAVLTLV